MVCDNRLWGRSGVNWGQEHHGHRPDSTLSASEKAPFILLRFASNTDERANDS